MRLLGKGLPKLGGLGSSGVIPFATYMASLNFQLWFNMAEASGNPVNAGTATGLTIAATSLTYGKDGAGGRPNEAIQFGNASTSRIQITNDAQINTPKFYGFLLKKTGAGGANAGNLCAFGTGAASGEYYMYMNHTSSRIEANFNRATTDSGAITTTTIPDNEYWWLFAQVEADEKCHIYKAQGGVVTEFAYASQAAGSGAMVATSATAYIGNRASAVQFAGDIDVALERSTPLTLTEMQNISRYFFDVGVTVTTPSANEVIQRSGTTGSIAITGTIASAGTYSIEARFNGGAWATIATGASGAYSGTLSGQAQGQGGLQVRVKDGATIATVLNVGIGDVFLVIGDSNAAGQLTSYQSYSHATLKASMLAKDYSWKNLADPTHSDSGVVDSAMDDPYTVTGTIWPLLATLYMAGQSLPIAFVPAGIAGTTAVGATLTTSWQPDTDHQNRATLYGAAVYRAKRVQGGIKAVLAWIGTNDAHGSVAEATFNTALDALVNALNADLSVKTLVPKLQNNAGNTDPQDAAVNNAIATAWADNSNVISGVDLTDLATDDLYHIKDSAKAQTVADRYWAALQTAFGW